MGVYQEDITEKVSVNPNPVSRPLNRGSVPEKAHQVKASKLDPYKATIDRLLKEGVWNAGLILREIQTDGYDGEINLVRKYIQPKQVMRSSRATVQFETRTGQHTQRDWVGTVTEVGGKSVKVRFIVNELGFSPRFHFWCTTCQDAEHTYKGIIRSLE